MACNMQPVLAICRWFQASSLIGSSGGFSTAATGMLWWVSPLKAKPQAPQIKSWRFNKFLISSLPAQMYSPPSEHFPATVLGRLILTAYTNAHLFCPHSSCTYNSHINTVKMKVFLHTLCAFSILVWASSASFKLSILGGSHPAA